MSHFAEIDSLQRVIRVLVIDDVDTQNEGGNEDDLIGMKYLNGAFGGTWLRTSYNTQNGVHQLGGTPFRKNFAAPGSTYDSTRDAFIPPKPFASWTFNETTCRWDVPVAMPDDGKIYRWDEATTNWKEIT